MGYLSDEYKYLGPLRTDQYQLTMGQGYFNEGRQDEQGAFYMHWRKPPFHESAGYTTVAGVEGVVDFLKHFKFTREDLDYLKTKKKDGVRLFTDDFIEYLRKTPLKLDVDAVPEGTVMTGPGPVIRIKGPIIQCQIVESAILEIMNSNSKIATRASRLCDAAGESPIADFALRRQATLDTGVARSAFIGGVSATSYSHASRSLGIESTGTMSHAWIESFSKEGISNKDSELSAFKSYLHSFPTNSVLLVDTYNIEQGIENAILAAKQTNTRLMGIRIDSGNLFAGYKEARAQLQKAKKERPDLFSDTKVFFTDGLDEKRVAALKEDIRGSGSDWPKIALGVGTQLGNPGPFDGGVYKMSAHEKLMERRAEAAVEEKPFDVMETWEPAMKVGGINPLGKDIPHPKSSLPGVDLDTVRLFDDKGKMLADVIVDRALEDKNVAEDPLQRIKALKTGKAISMTDNHSLVNLPKAAKAEFLLKPLFRHSQDPDLPSECLYNPPQIQAYEGGPMVTSLAPIQQYNREQREALPEMVKSLDTPERYPVFLDEAIHATRKDIMTKMTTVDKPVPPESIDVFIDLQPGFSNKNITSGEGGSLYVPEGEKTIEQAAELIKHSRNRILVFSQDFHPPEHISFMKNHKGVMEYREKNHIQDLNELVLNRDGNIVGIKEGDKVRKVELEFRPESGGAPGKTDRGRIAKVLDEYEATPFSQMKGVSTQMLWPEHCIQNTQSSELDPNLPLPKELRDLMARDQKSPDLEYRDPATGNTFYIIRKGMKSELDSYGLGIENDKRTRTTARDVFEKIANEFQDHDTKELNINIGGLASNFCVEFSHNNIVDEIFGLFSMRGIKTKLRLIHDISRGIPIPGGEFDSFSEKGAPLRMYSYRNSETKEVTSRTLLLERESPGTDITGDLKISGGRQQTRQR